MIVGRLQVISRAGSARQAKCTFATWNCICECGTECVIRGASLRNGTTKSCGCLQSEAARENGVATTKHGMHGTPEHRAWQSMIARCTNPKATGYEYWGGRGIRVCVKWRESFSAFLEEVGRRPSARHSLGRIENGGHYEPGNVRWETQAQQQNNRRSNRHLTVNGVTKTLSQWAASTGLLPETIASRLDRRGWPPELAVVARDFRAK